MLVFLLTILLLIFPWLIFVGIAFFALNTDEPAKKYRSRGLCTLPGCIRCNKNKQEFFLGVERFKKLYKEDRSYNRIRKALETSNEPSEELFLRVKFSESRPIWPYDLLSTSIKNDLQKLSTAAGVIASECDNALNCPYLWRRNEERSSFWYVFSLINQGAWQDEQCRVCTELVRILHSMNNIMTDCLLGNVFISMLPQNSEISDHCGMTNARLRVHFGVEVPSDRETCYMIVGGEKFNWTAGESTVFDDSFNHSVSSKNCKEDRLIVVFDFWHPELSNYERQCLTQIFPAAYN